MFFRKKKPSGATVPIEKIHEMSSMGMSDKDIIKKLKKEGYSYEDIERAMLQAVKQGVGEEPAGPAPPPHFGAPQGYQAPQAPPNQEPYGNEAGFDDIYGESAPQDQGTAMPELNQDLSGELEVPDSDVIVEELVEGVVDEKWQKLEDRLTKFEDKFSAVDDAAKRMEEKIRTEKQEFPGKELETRVTDLNTKLEDLEARIGGLEKAFRQFLPSLTRNIENLSSIIHEMKSKSA